MSIELVDAWRVCNTLLAVAALVMITRNSVRKWRRWTPRMRLLAQALIALLIVSAESSIENMLIGAAPGPRTALTTAACAWCVYALVATGERYERSV